jgi:hypothetical protein
MQAALRKLVTEQTSKVAITAKKLNRTGHFVAIRSQSVTQRIGLDLSTGAGA